MQKLYLAVLLLFSFSLSSLAQVGLPVDFESTELTYVFEGFEGADSAIEANPDQTGENTSATVMRSLKTVDAEFYAGTVITLDTPIDFSTNKGISIQTWSPKANIPVRVRLENADNTSGIELDVNTSVADAWETLTYDFESRIDPSVDYVRFVVFFEFINGTPGDGTTYYYDNMATADVSGGLPVTLPADFESADLVYDVTGFEGANSAVEMNPDQTGENTSTMVVRTTKTDGAAFFAGTAFNLDEAIDFSVNKGISISSWSPKAGIPVKIRLEDANNMAGIELDATTTVASGWETLTVDFSNLINPATNYVRVIVFFEFVVDLPGDGSTYYFDNVQVADVSGNTPRVVLPVDFELTDVTYSLTSFEGTVSVVEANPDQTGENTSATAVRVTKTDGAQFFAGTSLQLDAPGDFSENKGISISSWSPKADIPVRIQLEGAGTDPIFIDVNTTVASSWETLTVNFANLLVPGANYTRVVVFFEFIVDQAGDGSIYYYDNIAVVDGGDGTPPVTLPVDFESTELNYVFEGFEGAASAIEMNPDQTGENTSATAMRTTKTDGALFFAGTFLNLDEPIDFSVNKGIAIQTWSPKADIPVRIQLEPAAGAGDPIFVDVNTTVASSWETLTADFSSLLVPGVSYVRVTVFFEFIVDLAGDGSTYYYDNIETVEITDDSPPVTFPVGFENTNLTYDFAGFEGADSAIEMNPDQSGENTSATVIRTTKTDGAQFFAGTFLNLDEPINLSNTGKIVFSSWSPKAGIPVRVRLENAGNTAGIELDVNTVTASTWETLEADFSGIQDANVDYVRIVIFYEFIADLSGDGTTYYFDNLSVDELTSTRVLTTAEVQVFPNPTADLWQITSSEARIETLNLFDVSGKLLLNATPNTNTFDIDARQLPTGTYLVRVTTAEGRRIARLIKQ